MVSQNPLESFEKGFTDRVRSVLKDMGIKGNPVVQKPRTGHADLCLVTFPIAKELGSPPGDISAKVLDKMGKDDRWELDSSGGYLNCNFNRDAFVLEGCRHIKEGFPGGMNKDKGSSKVIVEHTSANPNGPFHVGRARNPIIGDTLVRLLGLVGNDVTAQYWVNDMGKQVMILVWGLKNMDPSSLDPPGRDKKDHDLVRFYQEANARMEKDPLVQTEIDDLLASYEDSVAKGELDRSISKEGAPAITANDVREACEGILDGMLRSLERMNIRIDEFVFESRVVEDGSLQTVIDGLKKSGLCRIEDGAFYLDLSKEIKGGDDDQFKRRFVFTRGDGSALYTTRDLAYHKWKLDRCDEAVNVLGEDHRYQSQMLSLALRELGFSRFPEAVFYSFVSLPQGKMSTRRNRVVFLDDLLDEAVDLARKEVEKRRSDLPKEDLERISEMVGIGALRFNMVKVQPEKKIVFRWEDALNFEGSTAPFVQYSHARACSILKKLEDIDIGEEEFGKLVEPSEVDLVKKVLSYPLLMNKAAKERKIHLVPQYLVELASSFNDFYRDCPVITDTDEGRRSARIFLVRSVKDVLSEGLDILGIEAPESM